MDYDNMIGKQLLDVIMNINSDLNNETYFIICPFHIGDFLIAGSLAHALTKPPNKKFTKIIALKYLSNMKVHFEGVDDIIYIPQSYMNQIIMYVYATKIYRNENYFYAHYKKTADGKDYEVDISLNFIQRYKHDIFEIPLETEFKKPKFDLPSREQISALHEKYSLNKNSIVLTPYSYSGHHLNINFWLEIINNLQLRGFKIYTNVAGSKEQPLPNTLPMRTTFSELYYLSDKVNCFVGMRSGLMDFLGLTAAKIICVTQLYGWFDDVKILFPESNCTSFYYAEPRLNQVKEYLFNFKTQNGIDLKMDLSISLKYSDGIICFNQIELLQNILDVVVNVN